VYVSQSFLDLGWWRVLGTALVLWLIGLTGDRLWAWHARAEDAAPLLRLSSVVWAEVLRAVTSIIIVACVAAAQRIRHTDSLGGSLTLGLLFATIPVGVLIGLAFASRAPRLLLRTVPLYFGTVVASMIIYALGV